MLIKMLKYFMPFTKNYCTELSIYFREYTNNKDLLLSYLILLTMIDEYTGISLE